MTSSAHDWASLDPKKNMVLAEADHFGNQLAGALCLQIGDRYIRTQYNQVIGEAELRGNQFMSPLAVNLCGHLAIPGSNEINFAEFRDAIRKAAQADDPIYALISLLQQTVPGNNSIVNLLTRIPAVQQSIASALTSL